MPEVTVRDARHEDAADIHAVWAAAIPYLVRSAQRAEADLRADATLGRRRWVGLVDSVVAGTATARVVAPGESFVDVEVRPELGSRGVGRALLAQTLAAFEGIRQVVAVCNQDPIALSFAIRHNFLPDGEHRVALVDPRTVTAAGPAPDGLTAVRLDRVPDLTALLATHNTAARDDPSGLSRELTPETFRTEWWDAPDHAPEVSWALLDESGPAPVVAAFTTVQVDRVRGVAWSGMTGTGTAYRGRGLATWVKRRTLTALAEAGVTEARTANDATNAPMLAVNAALGYRASVTSVRVRRRLH